MLYLWLKAAHLAAVVIWIGGMIMLGLVLAHATAGRSPEVQRMLVALHDWDRRLTSPAMGLAWLLGIAMVVDAGWLGVNWLWVKLVLVAILSALHGLLSGSLRRLAGNADWAPSPQLRLALPVTLAGLAGIAVMVTVKPF
jgi:uncharacterized membrane protein